MGIFDNLTPPSTTETTEQNGGGNNQDQQQQQGNEAGQQQQSAEDNQQSQNTNTQQSSTAASDASGQQNQVDYNKYLDEMSGGVIKDLDGFKAVLPRIQDYETLKAKNDELSAEMAKAPKFATDEVRILNELIAGGAPKEQIKIFHKINEYGNLTEMPDRDAIIAKMVMIDGIKPSVAEIKVDRDFKVKDDDLSEEDRTSLEEENLRIAANQSRKDLEKFKAEVSAVEQTAPEELRLQQEAQYQAHQTAIKPYVAEVVKSIPNFGTFNLAVGKDDAPVPFTLELDDANRERLSALVENFFMDGLTAVTPENTRMALNMARAEIIREDMEEILKVTYKRGVNDTTEKLVNKYENRSGLKEQKDNPILGGTPPAAATASFAQKVANRNVGG